MAAKASERGATLLMVAFLSTFLMIPIIGMCIDGAVLYLVKAKLSSAVDAAALSTARSLNLGQTLNDQECNAETLGAQYFTANFPTGIMGSSLVGGSDLSQPCLNNSRIAITEPVLHKRVVTVTVSVVVPLYFMRILGFKNSTVSATGQATRRDSNVMLVLDRSNSMNNSSGSCGVLVSSATTFANQFVNGRDQLGLVTFQTGANVDYAPTVNWGSSPSLANTLTQLKCAGDTSTAQGLNYGYSQIQNVINQPGALNVIVMFTDGQPNAIVGDFVIKSQNDTRYDAQNTSQLVSRGASSCTVTGPLTGVIADASTETATSVNSLNATGYTVAVLSAAGVPISSTASPTTINAQGCSFTNSNWSYAIYGRQDIAAIPNQDHYKNATVDRGTMPTLDTFTSGNYATQIRPDMPRTVRWAAFNAVDAQAQAIRNDVVYSPIIYTIGLQGNETMAMDQNFMMRVANDPAYSGYDPSKPQGKFYLANNNAELAQAFQSVASQILRLSQ
jgi:Mg-chelatase subunit ChlD